MLPIKAKCSRDTMASRLERLFRLFIKLIRGTRGNN